MIHIVKDIGTNKIIDGLKLPTHIFISSISNAHLITLFNKRVIKCVVNGQASPVIHTSDLSPWRGVLTHGEYYKYLEVALFFIQTSEIA